MSYPAVDREQGLVLISFVLLIILAMAAAAATLSVNSLRASSDAMQRAQAFYAADSGIQVATFMLIGTEGNIGLLPNTTFTEQIGTCTADVEILETVPEELQIWSVGSANGQTVTVQSTIRVHVGFPPLDSGYTITVNPAVSFTGSTIPVVLGGSSLLSGKDHDKYGNLLADQSKGTDAVSLSAVAHAISIVATGSGIIEGAMREDAPSFTESLTALRDFAMNNADITLSSGEHWWGNPEIGAFGTEASPKLIYATLDASSRVRMINSFEGWGTLVIEVTDANDDSAFLELMNNAIWHGPIFVYVTGDTSIDNGEYVFLRSKAKLIGSLSVLFASGTVEFNGGKAMVMSNQSKILYSSQLVRNAPGVVDVAPDAVEIISYRVNGGLTPP